MTAFIDPRSDQKAGAARFPSLTTSDLATLTELHQLCRDGRLYDVERWIQAGRPLQVTQGITIKRRRLNSALEIALDARNHSLVLLLLCNGYDPNLEVRCPLDLAIRSRRWDLVNMLLEWGADVHRVSLSDLFDSYNSDLWNRFQALGVDLTEGHALAEALAYHTSNKPLFGFARRQREHDPGFQRQLNIALLHHTEEDNEKGVLLCLWAGADPHAPAPSFRFPSDLDADNSEQDDEDRFLGWSAIEEACRTGNLKILERLGPDPTRDSFDDLYRMARTGYVVKFLARFALPNNPGDVIQSHLRWLEIPPFGQQQSVDPLRCLFEVGVRWETSSGEQIAWVRRSLLRMSDSTLVDVMKILATRDYCSQAILEALGRTPTMRARMKKVGFIPPPPEDRRHFDQVRPTRSREVLAKFGVEVPQAKPRLPYSARIGPWHVDGREIRLDRATLFEQVWTEPVEKLAKQWGALRSRLVEGVSAPSDPRAASRLLGAGPTWSENASTASSRAPVR
ncbi:MAG TPA: hypothetical protein VMW17_05310 [Candidatus Binatia bacterium]|nr:hypothetical protein [Candidatus Binatia bacterium]